MATTTIGFVPRERFALAAESFATLLATTPPGVRVIVVDPATPPRVRADLEALVAGRAGVELLGAATPLLPAAAKNLVLDALDDACTHVALVENDVLYPPGWLEGLLAACEQHPADVAAPLILEGRGDRPHFDRLLGSVRRDGETLTIAPLDRPRDSVDRRTSVSFVEQHCLVFRRDVFDRIGRYDTELNTRDEVDLSMALWSVGARVVLEPAVRVNYVPPSSMIEPDELEFYRQRWDLDRARRSRERIRGRWGLTETPGDLGFVEYRNLIPRTAEVRDVLAALRGDGGRVTLVDNGEWFGTPVTDGLGLRPFPDCGGWFGGFPADEATAVAELERHLASGTDHLVIGWPAYWWFDHLPGLADRLSRIGVTVRDDACVRVVRVGA